MESLQSLIEKKRQFENELARITIKSYGNTPWAPGVQDSFKSDSYSYEEYTNPTKARQLKKIINDLTYQINNYARLCTEEQARQKALKESQIPKYAYQVAGEQKSDTNPAIAARYNAQQRLFGMGKLKQTIMAINGQKKKFDSLWTKAALAEYYDQNMQEQIASELDKMFR